MFSVHDTRKDWIAHNRQQSLQKGQQNGIWTWLIIYCLSYQLPFKQAKYENISLMSYEQETNKKIKTKSIAVSCSNVYDAKSVTGRIVFGWQTCPSVDCTHTTWHSHRSSSSNVALLTSAKTLRTVRDGEPRAATSAFTQLLKSCAYRSCYIGEIQNTGSFKASW